MDIHPWTKYEVARLRDEERLLRARAAMRAGELSKAHPPELETEGSQRSISFLERLRGRRVAADRPAAGSGV
jgi:hypothetical protein